MIRHHQKAPELLRPCIELAAAASRPDHPAHTYFVERCKRSRAQFADGFPGRGGPRQAPRGSKPRECRGPLPGRTQRAPAAVGLDQDLDIVGPVTDFVRLLFEQDDAG
ncbi:hypothetical protein [Streptomyces sp. B21-108]|uniref:hypothetical protein n=1 Tax=Streptomyces sp. B21-108 TaxID=3039419 RepID=UPI002FF21060